MILLETGKAPASESGRYKLQTQELQTQELQTQERTASEGHPYKNSTPLEQSKRRFLVA
jgi:hypothetical protein